MTFYYESGQPMYSSLLVLSRTTTVFGMVGCRPEFWVFLLVHCTCVLLTSTRLGDNVDLEQVPWGSISATQLFMTFLMTFFNGHCYARYQRLYMLCMDVLDGVLFFVHELVISFAAPAVEKHRVSASKYVIALVHVFFIGITGGMTARSDWKDIVRRGLLTRLEADQLAAYPARSMETLLVIATWAMQVVDIGLQDECFWHERSMRIAHTHNRLNVHITQILHSIQDIEDVLALPIPFPYFHAMNVCLMTNLLGLAVVTATFKTYWTVFPYGVALGFFMGLREVSSHLADPFNGEDSDFPIDAFLQYAFDKAVCLLETFRIENGDSPEKHISKIVRDTKMFSMEQLTHHVPNDLLYQKNYDSATSSPFSWNKEMPLQEMASTSEGPAEILRATSLALGSSVTPKVEKKGITIKEREGEEEKPGKLKKCMNIILRKNKKKDAEAEDPKKKKHHHHHHHHNKKHKNTVVLPDAPKIKEKTELEIITDENQALEDQREQLKMHIETLEKVIRHHGFGVQLDRWKKTGSIEPEQIVYDSDFRSFDHARRMIEHVKAHGQNPDDPFAHSPPPSAPTSPRSASPNKKPWG